MATIYKDLRLLFNNARDWDLEIICKDGQLKAHRVVIDLHCPDLRAMATMGPGENGLPVLQIHLTDTAYNAAHRMLQFFYGGNYDDSESYGSFFSPSYVVFMTSEEVAARLETLPCFYGGLPIEDATADQAYVDTDADTDEDNEDDADELNDGMGVEDASADETYVDADADTDEDDANELNDGMDFEDATADKDYVDADADTDEDVEDNADDLNDGMGIEDASADETSDDSDADELDDGTDTEDEVQVDSGDIMGRPSDGRESDGEGGDRDDVRIRMFQGHNLFDSLRVYCLASKFNIPRLKLLARDRFYRTAEKVLLFSSHLPREDSWWTDDDQRVYLCELVETVFKDFPQVVRELYETVPQTDTIMRDIPTLLIAAGCDRGYKFWDNTKPLLREYPDLAIDIVECLRACRKLEYGSLDQTPEII